jgi:hypothetical protein
MLLIEIIALVFLCKKNGQLALQKGLKPNTWKLYTVLAWIGAEFIGCITAVVMIINPSGFDIKQIAQSDMLAISAIAMFAAFGGYLLVRYLLESKPDAFDNSVNEIGIDDLQPPKKND